MPLKGVPAVIGPDLLQALALAGHGDEIVLGDAYFTSKSIVSAGSAIYIRCDGISIPTLLQAITQLIELDTYVDAPVALMEVAESDRKRGLKIPVVQTYADILEKQYGFKVQHEYMERFAFYERAKKAFLIVHTGETSVYGNIILKNGIVKIN